MTDKKEKINNKLIIFCLAISIINFNVWEVVKLNYNISTFYITQATCFFVVALVLYRLSTLRTRYINFLFLALTMNNLLDEIFFNPVEIQINEYVLLAVAITTSSKIYINDVKRIRKSNE